MAKQEIKQEQVLNVEEAVSRSEAFINKNKKTISAVVLTIVALIVVGVVVSNYVIKPRENKAAEALFVGEKYFQNGDYETALIEFAPDKLGCHFQIFHERIPNYRFAQAFFFFLP